MPRGTSECGTPWAVDRHKREGTDPCPQDWEARRAYQRAWSAERKARAVRAASEVTREAQAMAARGRLEAAVLAAHEAGTLVLR
jgi:hypothetical protein